jgi:hypothetical protein
MQCVLECYVKMHNSIEQMKFVIQTAGIIQTEYNNFDRRIVFFQFPDNYNLYYIFYHSFGILADYLLW